MFTCNSSITGARCDYLVLTMGLSKLISELKNVNGVLRQRLSQRRHYDSHIAILTCHPSLIGINRHLIIKTTADLGLHGRLGPLKFGFFPNRQHWIRN